MGGLDRELLAEKAAAVEHHLRRVAARLPDDPAGLQPETDASDAVVLHLWRAVQTVIDLAVSACVQLGHGTPATYADALRTLGRHGVIDEELAARLARAAGLRNVVVHLYADLDPHRVHEAARSGPADLRAFLAALRDAAEERGSPGEPSGTDSG